MHPPPKKKNQQKTKQTNKQTNKNNNFPPQEFSEARFDWNKDYPNMK
jgi:hypothetical protein